MQQDSCNLHLNSKSLESTGLSEGDPALALNFRLDILSSEAMKSVDEVYRRECGLDVRHLRILRLIGYQPGITFSVLAEQTRFERALTSRIVTAFTSKGLVARRVSATDARQFCLHLTVPGEALRKQAGALGEELERLFLTPLTEEERTMLFAYLDKLTAWVRAGGGLQASRFSKSAARDGSPDCAEAMGGPHFCERDA